jgi:hypothetical protein
MMFMVQTIGNQTTIMDNFFNIFSFQYVTESIIKRCITESADVEHESTAGSGKAQ